MYTPEAFAVDDVATLHAFIGDHGFATLVTAPGGVPVASHLPFLLETDTGGAPLLSAHLARGNSQWRDLEQLDSVLVVFQGPHAYVSPNWYETPGLAPTWNYTAVHAYGRARLVEDEARTGRLMERLVDRFEGTFDAPWHTGRLDDDAFATMLGNIVAIEMPIERLEGKFKLSQNRSPADRRGVVRGLDAGGDPMAAEVARLMAADAVFGGVG
jgi:transcriptional regulator